MINFSAADSELRNLFIALAFEYLVFGRLRALCKKCDREESL